ncbi:hypothetical protein EDC01DRAFT_623556, partial [Geopyxis carbonaria]
ENPHDYLIPYDTVFIVDDSASMNGGGYRRWHETRRALESVAKIATRYNPTGIAVHFLNTPSPDGPHRITNASQVSALFATIEPSGVTPIGAALDAVLRPYLRKLCKAEAACPTSVCLSAIVRPLNIVVLTDGAATDDPEPVIVSSARELDTLNAPLHQCGVQFLQIGDEPGAREALKELDNDLAGIHGIRDMVDTIRYWGREQGEVEALLVKALIGGVNRRWDKIEV